MLKRIFIILLVIGFAFSIAQPSLAAAQGKSLFKVGGNVIKDSGAIIKGGIVELSAMGVGPMVSSISTGGFVKGMIVFSLLRLIGFLILVALVAAFAPRQLQLISVSIEKNLGKSFLYGLLACLLFVPVIVLLAISIVGIILIPLWGLLVFVASLFGYMAAAQFIGRKIIIATRLDYKTILIEAVIGVLILFLIGLLPLAGGLVKSFAGLCGLGAVALTRFGTRKA